MLVSRALTIAALAGGVLLSLSSSAAAQVPDYVDFAPAVHYSGGGNSPQSLAIGDFDGDGQADLAVGNWMSGGVGVLAGTGGGAFGAATVYPAGFSVAGVAVGQFNADSDSDPDLVAASSDGANVLLGDTGTTFGAATTFPAGNSPADVAVADFNGDNDPDLVVPNPRAGTDPGGVSVLLGGAGGSFGAPTSYPAGGGPNAVATGDFNGDGDPDLAVSTPESNGVAVLLGGVGGGFGAPTVHATGGGPTGVAVGDVNGDGDPDLALANSAGISVLLGGTGGTFGDAVGYAAGTLPSGVAMADVNGDGDPDLVVANRGAGMSAPGSLTVLLGRPGGSFGAAKAFDAGGAPRAVAAGDLSRDGAPDVVVTNDEPTGFPSKDLSVLVNNPVDRTTPPTAAIAATPNPVLAGQPVTFDAAGSQEQPGRVVTNFAWDLDGDGSFETNTGSVPRASRSYPVAGDLSPGVRITDQLGLSAEARIAVSVRPSPPAGSVGASINGGDYATNDRHVMVSLVWPALAVDALVSNDGGFGAAGSTMAFVLAPTILWQLPATGSERLPKIVFVRFRGAGADDVTHIDDIILDLRPPEVIAAEQAVAAGSSVATSARLTRYRIRLRARDSNSGVSVAQFARTKRGPKTTVRLFGKGKRGMRSLSRRVSFRRASRPLIARVQDSAGNWGAWKRITKRRR